VLLDSVHALGGAASVGAALRHPLWRATRVGYRGVFAFHVLLIRAARIKAVGFVVSFG
jgi:hypothetical protein